MNPHGTETAGKPSRLNSTVWETYVGAKVPCGYRWPPLVHAVSHASTDGATSCEVTLSRRSYSLKRRRKRSQFLARSSAASWRLFAERGYAQVTIEDAAAQVGCSVRTVTRYFPTKDALLLTQRRRMNQVVLDAFEAVAPGENAAAAIWQVWMDLALRAAVLGELAAYLDWSTRPAPHPT